MARDARNRPPQWPAFGSLSCVTAFCLALFAAAPAWPGGCTVYDPVRTDTTGYALAAADFNGDGLGDLGVLGDATGTRRPGLIVLAGRGTGAFGELGRYEAGTWSWQAAAVDVDRTARNAVSFQLPKPQSHLT